MAVVVPFPGMLFADRDPAAMAAHCCPPYDIIPPAQADHLHDDLSANAIRLELARGDEVTRYENARTTLDAWLADGTLKVADRDAIYIYEEEFSVPGTGEIKKLRGIIARVKLEEFSKGIVLPHEETLSKAKEDRFRLMRATGCNFSHIYSLYVDDEHEITPKADAMADRAADIEFTYEDGITHRLWIEEDPAKCAALCAGFADHRLYIADGHHRYETALRYRDTVRAENGGDAGAAEYVMMMLVDIDSDGLVVLPTHRELFDLEDFDPEEALESIEKEWDYREICPCKAQEVLDAADQITAVFCTADKCWALTLREEESVARVLDGKSAAYCSLDVAALHALILEPVFGIDKANMASQKNLRYTRSAEEAIDDVKNGRMQAAFLIRPTRVRQIKDVAQAGEKMPQKSTYFYPKILTGLVFNKF
ncbi:MAG: DUF1015 domain-containing protein [Ruminococcaceae bacterium]|nr:DUF1015 domain-containing protein [Oscillospiraceae bacterium]